MASSAQTVRTLRHAEHGSVAVLFALALAPVMVGIGIGVDYGRSNLVKSSAMQASLDAAGLMLARNSVLSSMTASQLQQTATAYFSAQFQQPDTYNVAIRSTYNAQTYTVNLSDGDGEYRLHGPPPRQDDEHRHDLAGDLGLHPAAARARARQYRVDERLR